MTREATKNSLKALRRSGRAKTAATQAVGVGVGTALPGSASIARLLTSSAWDKLRGIFSRSRDERLANLVIVVSGGRPDEFADELEQAFALGRPEADEFMDAAKVAADACSLSVVGAIGLLYVLYKSNRADDDHPLPRWKYRLYLKLLEELSDEEVRDLRVLVHSVLDGRSSIRELSGPDATSVPLALYRSDRNAWLELGTRYQSIPAHKQHRFCELQHGNRLFQVLLAYRFAEDVEDGVGVNYADLEPLAYALPARASSPPGE